MPGLWPWLEYDKASDTFRKVVTTRGLTLSRPPTTRRSCIVDGAVGFCGGLDPVDGRLDTPAHAKAWHDTHVQVDSFRQNQIITQLKTAIPAKFGAYSMVQKKATQKDHVTNFQGSFQVYVHSKALIVDDQFAMIGSANTNPRSFRVDTEANIAWYYPAGVKELRLALWREMLGSPADLGTWAPAVFKAKWDLFAQVNTDAKPNARKGFVVAHDPNNPKAQGEDASDSDIPPAYAELTDIDPEAPGLV